MATIDDLVGKWINRPNSHAPRQIGRYYASELHSIVKGYFRPCDWLKQKDEIDKRGIKNISLGMQTEDFLTRVFTDLKLDFQPQAKKELQIDDGIVLVSKPDFVFPKKVLECKCPQSQYDRMGGLENYIPERYKDQLEAYYRTFYLDVILVKADRASLDDTLYPTYLYEPSKARWNTIVDTIYKFHKQVLKNSKKIK